MNEELIEKLKKEFYISTNIDKKNNESISLSIFSDWKGKTNGVKSVRVYLSGRHPLTGEELMNNRYSAEFNAVKTSYDTGVLNLCGEYFLRFDAILETGEIIPDFMEPQRRIFDSPNGKPFIYYKPIAAPLGFKGFEFESNAWKRCNGKLWVKFDGHYQMLPEFKEDTMKCYIPASHSGCEFYSSDEFLPKPEKKTKEVLTKK